jgi:hypothetical protein
VQPEAVCVEAGENVTTGFASQLSVAVGDAGAGTDAHSTVVLAGTPDNTGAVTSRIANVTVHVEELLPVSVAVIVT